MAKRQVVFKTKAFYSNVTEHVDCLTCGVAAGADCVQIKTTGEITKVARRAGPHWHRCQLARGTIEGILEHSHI